MLYQRYALRPPPGLGRTEVLEILAFLPTWGGGVRAVVVFSIHPATAPYRTLQFGGAAGHRCQARPETEKLRDGCAYQSGKPWAVLAGRGSN